MSNWMLTRRAALTSAAGAMLFTPALVRAQAIPTAEDTVFESDNTKRNISAFRDIDWRDHYPDINQVTLIADTESRALHYWPAGGGEHRVFPTSVPLTEELTRRGYATIVRKKENPSWTPTAQEMRDHPDWHPVGPGPDNPLGTRAMYLSWPAYLIHGTHDTRKIGRPSSSGCIGLYDQNVEELFPLVPVGARVKLI